MLKRLFFTLLILITITSTKVSYCQISSSSVLTNKLNAVFSRHPWTSDSDIGICIIQPKTGEILYDYNMNSPMIPASNMKILTTATALNQLGKDYRYKTTIYTNGIVDRMWGTVTGDLILKGTGDPTLIEDFMETPTTMFEDCAQTLIKDGIKTVEGKIIGDDSAFDRVYIPQGWKSEHLSLPFAPGISALSLNGNTVLVKVSSNNVSFYPYSPLLKINGNAKSNNYNNKISIKGKLPALSNFCDYYPIDNPPLYTTSALYYIMQKDGIKINNGVDIIQDSQGYDESQLIPLYTYLSNTMAEIISYTNKESDNFCAEQIFKTLGYAKYGSGTCENGSKAVHDFMKENGIPSEGMSIYDGSGLSVYNRVSPFQITEFLRAIFQGPERETFKKSLSIAGKDGTIKYRMTGLPVWAKTGTLSDHSALSGYVITSYGQTLVFSILVNNMPTGHWQAHQFQDEIVKTLAYWSGAL